MAEVFINYRTGDGDEAAALLEQALSDRFGKERIFRDGRSIPPGEPFPEKLLTAVRRSHVLLAIIGPGWAQDPRLHDESDWVRRELVTARAQGVRVIPILKGRTTKELDKATLPLELEFLAETQGIRLDAYDSEASLKRIGDELAELVPVLRETDRSTFVSADSDMARNSARDIEGTTTQSRDITGGVFNTVIKDVQGSIHTGKGNNNTTHYHNNHQVSYHDSQHVSGGQGALQIRGDNHQGVHQYFDRSRENEDDN